MTEQHKTTKILIIDDNMNFLNSFHRIFSRQGFEISLCENPVEALDLIKLTSFDFIVSDEQMPYMVGTQFLEKVKMLQPDAKRILITGHPTLETSVNAINLGEVCGMLVKPFNASKLLAIINNFASEETICQ